jgi:hypothetical protein
VSQSQKDKHYTIPLVSWVLKFIESGMVIARDGVGGQKWKSYSLKSFCLEAKIFPEVDGGDSCTAMCIYLMPPNCTKNG